ncbi:MAG: autotransporter domain-containing protein, partial [Gammaproteobacteria bacterium]|nr:autotransporter domain-containing protein [Gammaproteobacteria bacterium]
TSTGDISTEGSFSNGIYGFVRNNGNVTITSTGNVTSLLASGIYARVYDAGTINITTSGTVSGETGIVVNSRAANAAPATITTSAAITGTGGTAIDLQGDANDTVNVLPGASFNGAIDFGNGNDGMGGTNANDIDTLNVAIFTNVEINFADTGGTGQGDTDLQSAPEIINAPDGLLINGGTTFVAVDRTGFTANGVLLGTLTNAIFNPLDNNRSAPQNVFSTHGGDGPYEYGNGPRYWLSGFGGYEEVEPGSNNAGIEHSFGAIMIGAEGGFDTGMLGLFGGYGVSGLDFQYSAGETDITTFFGGGYWKQDYGSHRIHLAFAGGFADHEMVRNIGATVANGDSNGWFISPSATIVAPITAMPVPTLASVRVSYAGMWLDGYTETGTVANALTVASRDVHLLNGRAQLIFPNTSINEDGSHTHMELRVGVDGQWDAGSGNATVATGGSAINFSADLDDQIAGFIGANFSRTSADNMFTLTASGELQSTIDGGYEATGELKAGWKF